MQQLVTNQLEADRPLHPVPPIPTQETRGSKSGYYIEMAGNVLTAARGLGALGMYAYIRNNSDYRSWKTAGAFAALALTDVDGSFSRFGRKQQGKDESIRRPLNAYGDQLTDKALVDLTMEAIAENEANYGDGTYARMVAAASVGAIARDTVVTVDRIIADYQGIDTRARKSGKLKTLKQYVVTTIALSPVANNTLARKALGAAFLYTTKESIESGIEFHDYLRNARQEQKQNSQDVIQCPDKVPPAYLRIVPDDTTQGSS